VAERREKGKATRSRGIRLSRHIRPERYALKLTLDPERSRRYEGSVAIELSVERKSDEIELHAVDLKLKNARVVTHDGRSLRAKVIAVPERESVRVVPSEAIGKGRARLELDFSGKLRADLRGLYFAQSGRHSYAFSQLEAADARRFFPCFDEPGFKARFAITVTTSAAHSVISNGKAVARKRSGHQQTVRFEETPLLSTYLVALGVGALDASKTVRAKRVPIRVLYATPERKPKPGAPDLTRFALRAAAECLTRLERYFGVPYPYSKLDLVAVPDFEMGAMENAGAVFFRETLLLIDEERATLAETKRAIEVICHELAHMWYGNLVTMAWWDDLWLNEAFATWMAFEIVDQWRPELRMWNDFGHSRASAFELDALRNTHAIYSDVKTPAQATESFDLITYEKGAAVIRMLERYLGPKRFRSGVRDYIRAHAGGNARASDLWHALEQHAGDAIEDVVRPWIERPGFPVVRARASGARVRLTQTRFSARGPSHARNEAPWPVPVVLREARKRGARSVRLLLETRTKNVLVRGAAKRGSTLYANADEGGFYRPLHDDRTFAALLEKVDALAAIERLGLVTHTWAFASAGYVPLARMLQLSLALGEEEDPDVLGALSGPLAVMVDRLAPDDNAAAQLRQRIAARFGPALFALGFEAEEREPIERSLRRAELLEIVAGIAEDEKAVAQARLLGARYVRKASSVEPNLSGPAFAIAARFADRAQHALYLERSEQARTPQDRRRYRMALADARDPQCIERVLDLCTTRRIPTQDVAIVLSRLCENPAARAPLFARIRSDWPRLARRLTPALAGRFVEATRALQTHVDAPDLLAFLRRAALPGTTRALLQLEERLALDRALRVRARRELAAR
jgi:puromycin-sensitive aminopeptidase